jgi:hypothetical protein
MPKKELVRQFRLKKSKHFRGLSFAPDGARLLALVGVEAGGADTAAIVDVLNGVQERTFPCVAHAIAVAPDHSRLVAVSEIYRKSEMPQLARWCDPREERTEWAPVTTGLRWSAGTSCLMASGAALAPDNITLHVPIGRQVPIRGTNSASWSFHLARCNLDTGTSNVLDPPVQLFNSLFAPSGNHWATLQRTLRRSPDSRLTLWERNGDIPVATFSPPGSGSPGCFAFSPDGRFLAVAISLSIHILDAVTLQPLGELKGHAKQIKAIAFSSDSQTLLSASNDGSIRVWNPSSAQPRGQYDWGIGPVQSLAFAPDGLTCAAAGQGGRIVIWDVDS